MSLFPYIIYLADTALIAAQRNSEWCGHGPVLEQDIAITNIALDGLGQARNLYALAATLYNGYSEAERQAVDAGLPQLWKTFGRELQEDDLAFLREERQYRNLLLCELPKGDWAVTVLRQFFLSAYQQLQYEALRGSLHEGLAAIAEKSIKEVQYHLRWSSEWVIRLGDGTGESRRRIEAALQDLWPFTGEAFVPAGFETAAVSGGWGTDPTAFRAPWLAQVQAVFSEAGLEVPATGWMQSGGKEGRHTEHLGYILAEMQYLQRAYPNAEW